MHLWNSGPTQAESDRATDAVRPSHLPGWAAGHSAPRPALPGCPHQMPMPKAANAPCSPLQQALACCRSSWLALASCTGRTQTDTGHHLLGLPPIRPQSRRRPRVQQESWPCVELAQPLALPCVPWEAAPVPLPGSLWRSRWLAALPETASSLHSRGSTGSSRGCRQRARRIRDSARAEHSKAGHSCSLAQPSLPRICDSLRSFCLRRAER